jgi:hypothetical protein
MRCWPHAAPGLLTCTSRSFDRRGYGFASGWNAWQSNPMGKRQENVMRQRSYPQVKPADPAASSASALQAVQVSLDRRDNGGDAHTGDDE